MSEPRLLLLARAGDPAIPLLRQYAGRRLAHADIDDFLHAGWRYVGGSPDRASAFASGRAIAAKHIAAVLCRIRQVTAQELHRLHSDDREYAAEEINAFLRAWLMQFQGVRFNAPSGASLAGIGWHRLQWIHLAAKLGIPTTGCTESKEDTLTATLVSGQVIGTRERTLKDYVLRIAAAVPSQHIAIRFVRERHWKFHSADSVPAMNSAIARSLVMRAFANEKTRGRRAKS